MITEKNKIYNAAYDLIYRNIRDNPNKIAFIDNIQIHHLRYRFINK